VWGLRTLEILWQDLRYGLRMILKRPGVTLIAIGIVAIGVAANKVVVLRHSFWQRRFNSDPDIVGKTMSLSLVLLIGAGLMVRSFAAMLRDDFGFKPENLLTIDRILHRGQESNVRNIHDQALKRLETLPGVTAVGASNGLPMGANENALIRVAGCPLQNFRRSVPNIC
jgi:hypothetical protein